MSILTEWDGQTTTTVKKKKKSLLLLISLELRDIKLRLIVTIIFK